MIIFFYDFSGLPSVVVFFRTYATLNENGTEWSLTGEKTGVINAGLADLMIVFAKTKVVDVGETMKETVRCTCPTSLVVRFLTLRKFLVLEPTET